jgi:hypothetical protein
MHPSFMGSMRSFGGDDDGKFPHRMRIKRIFSSFVTSLIDNSPKDGVK